MSDKPESITAKNFLPSDARSPNEAEYVSISSVLCKEEVNRKLDFILQHIYKFSSEYCITEEQTITFIQKRYYQLHYIESSYQIDLDCFIEPTKQKDLDGNQIVKHHIVEKYHRKASRREEEQQRIKPHIHS